MEAFTQYIREIAHSYIGITPVKSMKWGHWAHKFCLHNLKPTEIKNAFPLKKKKVWFKIWNGPKLLLVWIWQEPLNKVGIYLLSHKLLSAILKVKGIKSSSFQIKGKNETMCVKHSGPQYDECSSAVSWSSGGGGCCFIWTQFPHL